MRIDFSIPSPSAIENTTFLSDELSGEELPSTRINESAIPTLAQAKSGSSWTGVLEGRTSWFIRGERITRQTEMRLVTLSAHLSTQVEVFSMPSRFQVNQKEESWSILVYVMTSIILYSIFSPGIFHIYSLHVYYRRFIYSVHSFRVCFSFSYLLRISFPLSTSFFSITASLIFFPFIPKPTVSFFTREALTGSLRPLLSSAPIPCRSLSFHPCDTRTL